MSLADLSLSHFYAALRLILPRWTHLQTALKGVFPMFSQVTALLRSRSEKLLNGQLDELAANYVYPLPVHLGPSLVIVRSATEARSILAFLREALAKRGVFAVQPKVVAIDLPRAGRFRVWVDWNELAIPVEGTRRSSAIYYCKTTSDGLKTEMVNYTQLSMPELNPQFAALALSA